VTLQICLQVNLLLWAGTYNAADSVIRSPWHAPQAAMTEVPRFWPLLDCTILSRHSMTRSSLAPSNTSLQTARGIRGRCCCAWVQRCSQAYVP
jgi:hypothetical protein